MVGLSHSASEASGVVGVFISTQAALPHDAVRAFLRNQGSGIAGLVECRNSTSTPVDASNAWGIAEELTRLLAKTRSVYPNHSGLALFVAGPASLAFMVGRAFNPRAMGGASVASFAPPNYELALTLPWTPVAPLEIRQGAEHADARQKVLTAVTVGVQMLKDSLQHEDLPQFLTKEEGGTLLSRLRRLTIADAPEGDETQLRVDQQRLTLGRGLLEAMRLLDETYWVPLAQQFLLHELFHYEQSLTSLNYRGVGRGGFALEEVDYWADTFAIHTLASCQMREAASRGLREPARILAEQVDVNLRGIEVFDRAENGGAIRVLLERRMRRYLLWSLQYSRATMLRHDTDICEVLGDRLIVELAPLHKRFDNVHDTVVVDAPLEAELFVVRRGHLMRLQRRPGFDPASLVEAVRGFAHPTLRAAMDYVADAERKVLTPWLSTEVAGPGSQ